MDPPALTRVLFLSQAPGVGGGERATLPALAWLPDLDVTVVAPEPVCLFAEKHGLRAIRLELPRAHKLTHLPMMGWRSRRILQIARGQDAALVYANGTRALPYAVGARLLGGPPLLAHHHGLLTTGPVRLLLFGLKWWADAIVVPSNASASPLRPKSKVHVIPNGIDLGHFRPAHDRAGAKEALGLPRESWVVGMVGRANPGRGMAPFIDLVRRLVTSHPAVRFVLAGGAAFPHEREHYELISRHASEIGDRLVLTGHLQDPLPAYHAIDVFVHLADPEGFGLTVVEAMACGIPVVAYRWGGVAEILEDGASGFLVEPGSLKAAAQAVEHLLVDEKERHAIGERGRAVCEERYGLERYARTIASLIREVAGRTP